MHVGVSDLYDYQMFYFSTSILRDSMQTEIQKKISLKLSDAQTHEFANPG